MNPQGRSALNLKNNRDQQPAAASGRKVALGAAAFGAVNIFKAVVQLLLLPVMARLLGPAEFGLYSLALPTIALVALLSDGGLGYTLAREDEASSVVWSSAFWVLLFLGFILAIGVSLFGLVLGYISSEPRLPAIIAILSISLIFLTVSVVPSARLIRRKNLGAGAGADLSGVISGAVVAIVLAENGAGAWSLALQYVTTYVVRAIVLNFTAFYLPKAEFSFAALGPHLMSGGILVTSRIVDYAGRLTENFIINHVFGSIVLGNYTFANQISRFSTEAVSNVVWGGLYAQALTGDRTKMPLLHRRLCRMLGIILFSSMFLAAAAAPELVDVLLGPKWTDLSLYLRVLLPIWSFQVICTQSVAVIVAYGRFDVQFWSSSGFSLGRVFAVCLAPWIGLSGTIFAIGFVTLIYCVVMLIVASRLAECPALPLLRSLAAPALSATMGAGTYLLLIDWSPINHLWIITSLFSGFAVYAVCMVSIDRKTLLSDWQSIRELMGLRAVS